MDYLNGGGPDFQVEGCESQLHLLGKGMDLEAKGQILTCLSSEGRLCCSMILTLIKRRILQRLMGLLRDNQVKCERR